MKKFITRKLDWIEKGLLIFMAVCLVGSVYLNIHQAIEIKAWNKLYNSTAQAYNDLLDKKDK